MGNPNPKTKWKKGDKAASLAGQKSSRALPPDLKDARKIRSVEFESIIYKYMDHSPLEIKEILDNNYEIVEGKKVSKLPSKELIILKLVHKAIEDGDVSRLNLLLDRSIGKVVDKIDVDAKLGVYKLHDAIMFELEKGDKE